LGGNWLSLSEVSEILGVHPSTVRNWADQGRLPVHRTQGGHRRFRRNEIDLWMQARRANKPADTDMLLNNAFRQVRLQISDGRMADEAWYQKLDEDAIQLYRRTSRSLVLGMAANLSTDESAARSEARGMGYEYASLGRRYGLSSIEAVHAFLFFRNALLDSILTVFEAAAIESPHAWADMLRKINAFTDSIMINLLETYEVYERTNS
jgi:excisionase family DNA binding protein